MQIQVQGQIRRDKDTFKFNWKEGESVGRFLFLLNSGSSNLSAKTAKTQIEIFASPVVRIDIVLLKNVLTKNNLADLKWIRRFIWDILANGAKLWNEGFPYFLMKIDMKPKLGIQSLFFNKWNGDRFIVLLY